MAENSIDMREVADAVEQIMDALRVAKLPMDVPSTSGAVIAGFLGLLDLGVTPVQLGAIATTLADIAVMMYTTKEAGTPSDEAVPVANPNPKTVN